ncbi:hypothetical protein DM02DRAFT_419304 [Periconia macrospinosa]|uniref:Uncharacterized protein n=1 Tax=Periconia macrospinosa TaxID=97972 RepID=A0A2V1DN60_9PLEO|nr:hypothetical protein DM02DRAFT_419304 [Periconia macrospinosa]
MYDGRGPTYSMYGGTCTCQAVTACLPAFILNQEALSPPAPAADAYLSWTNSRQTDALLLSLSYTTSALATLSRCYLISLLHCPFSTPETLFLLLLYYSYAVTCHPALAPDHPQVSLPKYTTCSVLTNFSDRHC